MKIDALGFVEARGFITAIVAADAMVKAANVKLIRQHQVDPRFITLVVEGDLAACRAAVDAGIAAGSRIGEIVSRLEIGRPDSDTERMVMELVARSKENPVPAVPTAARTAAKTAAAAKKQSAVKPTAFITAETSPVGTLPEGILAFITENPKGRSWMEISNRFPQYRGQKNLLDDMVAKGLLRKAGNRYLKSST